MPQTYEELSKEDLIRRMVRRDAERKFGLVWERNEIEREEKRALTGEVVFAVLGGRSFPVARRRGTTSSSGRQL
jgi:hypothetical protein